MLAYVGWMDSHTSRIPLSQSDAASQFATYQRKANNDTHRNKHRCSEHLTALEVHCHRRYAPRAVWIVATDSNSKACRPAAIPVASLLFWSFFLFVCFIFLSLSVSLWVEINVSAGDVLAGLGGAATTAPRKAYFEKARIWIRCENPAKQGCVQTLLCWVWHFSPLRKWQIQTQLEPFTDGELLCKIHFFLDCQCDTLEMHSMECTKGQN